MNGENRRRIKKEIIKVESEIEKVNENIFNVPNFFTTIRIIITFAIIFLVFDNSPVSVIAVLFIAGMITDFLDGNIARIFNQKTEFGRKYDIIADRFLMIGTVVAILIHYSMNGIFGANEIAQIFLIMLREIIALPFVILAFFEGKFIPNVRIIGKVTTVLQAITFPVVILKLSFSWPLVGLTAIIGLISGITYAHDLRNLNK